MNAQQKQACIQRQDETSVNEFLAEELTRVTKSKNKSELELARVKKTEYGSMIKIYVK